MKALHWILSLGIFLSLDGMAQQTPVAPPTTTGSTVATQRILIGVPNNVFARLDEGQPTGIMLEAVNHIALQMGLQPSFVTMPASDIPKALDSGQIDIAAVRIQSSRGKESALFTDPIIHEHNVPIARAGEGFSLRKVSDLNGKRVAGRAGYHYPALEKATNVKMERFDSDGAMIRALLHKKTDVVIIAALSDIYVFRAEGVMRRVQVLDSAIGSVALRAAFTAKRYTPEHIVRFNELLAVYQKGSAWQQTLERNGFADLVHDWPMLTD